MTTSLSQRLPLLGRLVELLFLDPGEYRWNCALDQVPHTSQSESEVSIFEVSRAYCYVVSDLEKTKQNKK